MTDIRPVRQRDLPCSEPGCTKWASAKGLCKPHYQAAYMKRKDAACSEPDCGRGPVVAKGLCPRCYQRKRKAGQSTGSERPRAACTVPACTRTVLSRGYCRNHYASWVRFGDPAISIYEAPKPNPSNRTGE